MRLIRGLRPYSKNSLGFHLSIVSTIVSYSRRPRHSVSLNSSFRGAIMVRTGQPGMDRSKNLSTRVRKEGGHATFRR